MRPSWPEVAIVAIVLGGAILGGCLGVLSSELVAALVTGALSYLAWRSRERPTKDDQGAVPEAVARTPSAKITVDREGRIVVEPAPEAEPRTEAEKAKETDHD